MKYVLTEKEIAAIEKAINKSGSPTVEVCIKSGKIAVYQVNSTKVI